MYSEPVIGDQFFGRRDIIDLLKKRVFGLKAGYRQNVAIIGHRHLGKTSLLRHFIHTLDDKRIVPVYVEIKFQPLKMFVEQFIRSLFYSYLTCIDIVIEKESLADLIQETQKTAPKAAAKAQEIVKLIFANHHEEAYSRLFELTTLIHQESSKNCIVVIDEFHRLGEFGLKNAFADFGKRIMIQKDTMYLLASSSFLASRKILSEKLSLLFGHFERIYLEPFDFDTCHQFLRFRMTDTKIPDNTTSFLTAFTDGQPFFMDVTANKLKELCMSKSESELTKATVSEAFHRLFYDSQGVFNQYFAKILSPWNESKKGALCIQALIAISHGSNKLKDVQRHLNISLVETSKVLEELLEGEYLVKTGVFYRFPNKIFKFWLREVYDRKEFGLGDPQLRSKKFMDVVEKSIDEHQQLAQIATSGRIADLLSRFDNDFVEFGEKKRKLPHFTETIQVPSEGSEGLSRKLIAKGRGSCWLCQITEGRASEKEVLELLKYSKQKAPKNSTKVLMAIDGIDDNALLLAKEKKILTLGLSKLNMLLDVYDRAPIVRLK